MLAKRNESIDNGHIWGAYDLSMYLQFNYLQNYLNTVLPEYKFISEDSQNQISLRATFDSKYKIRIKAVKSKDNQNIPLVALNEKVGISIRSKQINAEIEIYGSMKHYSSTHGIPAKNNNFSYKFPIHMGLNNVTKIFSELANIIIQEDIPLENCKLAS